MKKWEVADVSCHTYPNDNLLQPRLPMRRRPSSWVVILTQTISFYNTRMKFENMRDVTSCHTYPNDKLLQLNSHEFSCLVTKVVILTQTISFYNKYSTLSKAKP